jgi:hypothetical protein
MVFEDVKWEFTVEENGTRLMGRPFRLSSSGGKIWLDNISHFLGTIKLRDGGYWLASYLDNRNEEETVVTQISGNFATKEQAIESIAKKYIENLDKHRKALLMQ